MIDEITGAFPMLRDHCREDDFKAIFYISDPGGGLPCTIVEDTDNDFFAEGCVTVLNPREHTVHLIAIDQCLTRDMAIKSCDCILVGYQSLVFLELKLNITTTRLKNADDTREGGLFQIAQTFNLFEPVLSKISKKYPDVIIVAQIATPPVSPKSNATYNLIRSAFGEKYGYDYIDSHEVLIN